MSTGIAISRPPLKTGIEISDHWYSDSCRLVEESLTTGIEKTIPKRYLMVLIGKMIGLASIPEQKRQKFVVERHLPNAGETA